MPSKAKKTVIQDRPGTGAGFPASTLGSVKGRGAAEVPSVAMSRLMAELEQLKRELIICSCEKKA